ncbi:DNA-processing protein DprA [Pontixanthobacter sp. CEM42]|uniref:DNA-processing protein DprA n=1 Tax=Pontixanthobacter sp. CEM42 TaxID=2792077 RepID=UPI001AE0BDEB|nr:DNA-processing protein DprA [Pontixanthobacter sp. CEM42]
MLQVASDSTMPRRSKYQPPDCVESTSLLKILRKSGRDELEKKQLDFLDRAAASTGKDDLEIFYAGDIELTARPSIAVIGTRKVSEDGKKRAHRFARELAERNVVVVSGLAAGIDTCALRSAINAGGSVIAVIGTPIDKAYPAANKELQETIYHEHLLVSQFPVGQRTYPSDFPARNRTMAAISDASVIIEASESSGTLHQASECMRLGRWLGISRSVVDDPRLTWPEKFLSYSRCFVLESTDEVLDKIYGK